MCDSCKDKVIKLIERANVNWKKEVQHLHWIGNSATKWKFLPWTHEIPPWGGIDPRYSCTVGNHWFGSWPSGIWMDDDTKRSSRTFFIKKLQCCHLEIKKKQKWIQHGTFHPLVLSKNWWLALLKVNCCSCGRLNCYSATVSLCSSRASNHI